MSENNNLVLYNTARSFYSQKVRVMLVEKGIPYENRSVVFDKYETYEPWYLKMNPQGQVPMLKHKDKIVYDSKDIMAYLDKTFKDKPPTFYPPIGTTEGDAVKYWETTLDGVNVFILTYGSFAHPELSDKDLSEREAGKRIADDFQKGTAVAHLGKLRLENPDLDETYAAVIKRYEARSKILVQKQALVDELERTAAVLDTVEETLKQQDSDFLVGSSLTTADVCLFVLLRRLVYAGFKNRFWGNDVRPNILEYYEKMAKRESFKKETIDIFL